jgi:hypothetical protein
MATLPVVMKEVLQADATLTGAQPDGLGFTVWDRWLIASGPGSTPEAFDPTRGGRLKRNIVVLDGGEYPTSNPFLGNDGKRWNSYPTITVFVEATAAGKAALDAAALRIESLLRAQSFMIDGNQNVSMEYDSRVPITDSDQFPGNVVAVLRYQATGVRLYS